MSPAENRHAIAASNFFLGTANFLVIELPPGWDLRIGARPPEVDRTRRDGEVAWVTEGTASHLLVNESRRLGLLMEATARWGQVPGRSHCGASVRSQGEVPLGGHTARWRVAEGRRGRGNKKIVSLLELDFYCDRGNRTVSLSVSGEVPLTVLDEFLAVLSSWECHSQRKFATPGPAGKRSTPPDRRGGRTR